MEFHVYTECQESKTTFNNIQRAYNAMADLHAKCALEQPAKIFVHGGTYHITSPLHFDGTFPVSIEAYEKEKPVISGAMQLTDWTPCRINGISAFRTVLPPEIRELPFFYVNGKLAQPARYPKQDLFRVTDELSTSFGTNQYNHDNFHYEEGAFDPSWYDLQNIGIVMTHLWVSESLRIESVDTEERKIVTADSIIYTPRKKNTEFYFTNVREALSEPGEYYYDRNTREIFYIPEKKQKNFCGECNCSCTCNADCEGDVKKCTSQKAQEKQCAHCCDCFITPFIKVNNANIFGNISVSNCERINK